MRRHIPNILTLANLATGCIALVFVFNDQLQMVFWLIVLAGIFDLFDGMVARILDVSGVLGKQLDSLADMISFGLVPGALAYQMISVGGHSELGYLGFLLTLGAAYRLAVFNIDESQSSAFIGLATPSMAFFVTALPHIELEGSLHIIEDILHDPIHLIGVVVLLVWLMNSKMHLLSAKVNLKEWRNYKWRISFIILSAIIVVLLGFAAAPIVLLLYLLFSLIETRTSKI